MSQIAIDTIIDDMVRRIVDEFHPERIILFGSHARGDSTDDSDIDLLVVMPVKDSARKQANAIDLMLADRTTPLDVIVVTPEQYERERNVAGSMMYDALREGQVLHDSSI